MDNLDALAQVVFFVLIVAGWVIKAVVESRKSKQQRTSPPPPSGEENGEEGVPRPVHVPRTAPPPVPRPTRGPLSASLAGRTLHDTGGPLAPGRLLESSAAAIAHGKQAGRARRASVVERLTGGQSILPGRELTRAGVLWSEILGPCRALTGPHRSPAATRRRCR